MFWKSLASRHYYRFITHSWEVMFFSVCVGFVACLIQMDQLGALFSIVLGVNVDTCALDHVVREVKPVCRKLEVKNLSRLATHTKNS